MVSFKVVLALCLAACAVGEIPDAPISIEEALVATRQSGGGLCLSEHNQNRQQNGKPALTYDARLERAAQQHNQVMTSQNCFDHQCPGEAKLGDRVTKQGYRWGGVAENIAAGQNDCKSVMSTWMNSPGHKSNILGNYKNVGCARQECSSCKYKVYWTCVFASPL